ncbi:MAG: dihydrofolate reductase [Candidatus Doudnabacteria bacterium]|nr:dihydrofolate reductase [Candidatus Doudnabacteria bacterium]
MKKLIMWNLVTVDGYFEGEKPWDLEFHNLVWGKELEDFSVEQLKTASSLVFGERTYKGMADYWIKATDEGEVTGFMNSLPKIVCSTTLQSTDWNNTTIARDAVAELAKLKQEGSGNLFVFGSGELSDSLMKANLFDEYRLCVVPVFLGKGNRLFKEGLSYQKLKLLNFHSLQTGGVILTYAPAQS